MDTTFAKMFMIELMIFYVISKLDETCWKQQDINFFQTIGNAYFSMPMLDNVTSMFRLHNNKIKSLTLSKRITVT